MEDFGSILDLYLDQDEIEEKIKQDKNNEAKNKKNSKTKSNNFSKVISISDFVNYYLGAEHDCTALKHQGLKSFKNPYVVGVSNNFALKNPDCVMRNEILVVIDAFGNPGTYINPKLLKNVETMEEYKFLLGLLHKIKLHSFENANNLAYLHKSILLHIEGLEKSYIDSCDLLKTLSKENLLEEMRMYAKKIHETQKQWLEEIIEVDNIIDYEVNILSHSSSLVNNKQKKKSK